MRHAVFATRLLVLVPRRRRDERRLARPLQPTRARDARLPDCAAEARSSWGLNTSANPRSLRDSVSMQLGLVNGYFFGVVTRPELGLEEQAAQLNQSFAAVRRVDHAAVEKLKIYRRAQGANYFY